MIWDTIFYFLDTILVNFNDISLAEKGQSCSGGLLFGYSKNWRLSNREKCIFREIPALARRNSDGNKFKLDNTWYFFYPKYSCVANVGENMESYRSIPDILAHVYTYIYTCVCVYIYFTRIYGVIVPRDVPRKMVTYYVRDTA